MRLIIVSNRLPVTVVRNGGALALGHSAGGMAGGVNDFLTSLGGAGAESGASLPREWLWVGWPGGAVSPHEEGPLRVLLQARNGVPVFLSPEEEGLFYDGFSNRVLWPLSHYFTDGVRLEPRWWEGYRAVNARFAKTVGELLRPDDLVWVHDYQLMLVPGMIRATSRGARIGYFHHIPFPEYEILRALPAAWRHDLLEGVLGADRVGFHTHSYAAAFLRAARRDRGVVGVLGEIVRPTHTATIGVYPLGIDVDRFERGSRSPLTETELGQLSERFGDRTVVISIDRLDYTKGLIERLRGFERFLTGHPEWCERVTLALIVVPSRVTVPSYRAMKRAIDQLVGDINGRLSTPSWAPIAYRYVNLPPAELCALYRRGDIALVTPLRDGMNLVAKEYVIARGEAPGVLILSRSAGAADELAGALTVDPADEWSIAGAIERAVSMSPLERRERFQTLGAQIKPRTVARWGREFLTDLQSPRSAPPKGGLLPVSRLVAPRFRRARERLLFLDYDGTVVGFQIDPHAVRPDTELLHLLERLAGDPRTSLVIVSGRDRATLERWFGHLPLGFIAEHGGAVRTFDGAWSRTVSGDDRWKERIRPVLARFVHGVPGSFIEEKETSLVWHYRGATGVDGAARAEELGRDLIDFLLTYTAHAKMRVLAAHKAVEVQQGGVDKGEAAVRFVDLARYDFIGALGDDRTDEDLFAALPPEAYTIRIGLDPSRARFRLHDPTEARLLLADCIAPVIDGEPSPYFVPKSRSPASPSPGTM